MGHADFRVGKRIFATLGHPDASFGMIKLTPAQQAELVESAPRVFAPVPGGWGRQGSTHVKLRAATEKILQPALLTAWTNIAPRRLDRARHRHGSRRLSGAPISAISRSPCGCRGRRSPRSYGTPSIKVMGKLLSRWRTEAEGALAIRCGFLDRQILLQADPEAFFLTDHYRDYPMVLVRLECIDARALSDLTRRAWRLVAPKTLRGDDSDAPPAAD